MEKLLAELNPVIHLFGRGYEFTLKRSENWEVPEEYGAGYSEVFYTDGSKTEQGSGAGVYLSNKNEKSVLPLGQYTTVFQAEVYVNLRAEKWMIDERFKGRRITICSDNQAALRAVLWSPSKCSGIWKPFGGSTLGNCSVEEN